MKTSNKKILVGMSGGVDSSVAALLLMRKGYTVIGATMNFGTGAADNLKDCSLKAVNDAKTVCEQLGIQHYVFDFSQYHHDYVIMNFIDEYRIGRTPNPCVRCNRYLKFNELLHYAREYGCKAIATGHYIQKGVYNGKPVLLRNHENSKDQSYFLYNIKQDMLDYIEFPIASTEKKTVREIAKTAGLHIAEKAESQEICFIPDNNYRHFLHLHGIADSPGDFIDIEGTIIGTHKGIFNYTIGQRKGLGLALGRPYYVVSIDADSNTVTVGTREYLQAIGCDAIHSNLFVDPLPKRCSVKVRYGQKDIPCSVQKIAGTLSVLFDDPIDAVTPGQSLVLYDNEMVLGGGIIRNVVPVHSP